MFRFRPRKPLLLTLLAVLGTGALLSPAAQARLKVEAPLAPQPANPAETLIAHPLDFGSYDRATHCVKDPTKGALALVGWLPQVSPSGENWGIIRCEMWGKKQASLHAEGRAVDWHLDFNNPATRAEADKLVSLLLAPDSLGQEAALARRLGIQGLIWDCRAWFGQGAMLTRYSVCTDKNGAWKKKVDPTLAHRDHVHLELSKDGAALRTSWWTDGPGRKAAATATAARAKK